ncbi:unnamed protein product [Urochloa humidicola]
MVYMGKSIWEKLYIARAFLLLSLLEFLTVRSLSLICFRQSTGSFPVGGDATASGEAVAPGDLQRSKVRLKGGSGTAAVLGDLQGLPEGDEASTPGDLEDPPGGQRGGGARPSQGFVFLKAVFFV